MAEYSKVLPFAVVTGCSIRSCVIGHKKACGGSKTAPASAFPAESMVLRCEAIEDIAANGVAFGGLVVSCLA
jgi:hypothetical protein